MVAEYNRNVPESRNSEKIECIIKTFFACQTVNEAIAKEFCTLIHCDDKQIVSDSCMRCLINIMNGDFYSHPLHAAVLQYFLMNVDTSLLDVHTVIKCTQCVVNKLNPKKNHVAEATLPSLYYLFDALSACLLRLNSQKLTQLKREGLYADFESVIGVLAHNSLYKISYWAKRMQQNLVDIGNDETAWQFRCRVGYTS